MSKPIINPYYSKWDTPKPQNRFQTAVFNGRTIKVADMIASGENVYATTDLDENPLFIAIVRDHTAIVNQILDIYDEDLRFVREFFQKKYNIVWTQRLVFVAHGTDNICLVNQLSAGMDALPDQCLDKTQTMVILLKSLKEKKILWLRPNSSEDNVKIAKIIECIWNDGVIDPQHKGHWGRTVLDVAAIRNQPEIYYRLHTLSTVDQPEKSIAHFLQMCRHYDDKLSFFEEIWNKICQQYDITDILSTNLDLLALPSYYDQFEIFILFLENLADKTEMGESRQVVMTNILNTYKVRDDSTLMETIICADEKTFVQQCLLRLKPDLLSIGACKETLLQTLIRQKSSEFMTHFVVECFNQVLTAGMESQIVMQLIEGNWLAAVKILYDRYQSCRKVLFRNKKYGVRCLMSAIDGCRYDLANYLVDAHRDELTDPDDVTQLILYCSFVERSNVVLRTLLTLSAADPLQTSGPEHYYKSSFYVALTYRHLENFQLLLDNVRNVQGLKDLKEDNGENLLFAAIWFKENPVDETPFVYIEEEQASLEIVDSSDDEDDSVRKTARNKEILTSTGPYKDPIMPDSFFEKQSMEMTRIFNYFLKDLGLDYQCVNNTGETLLHIAVKRDNFDAVNQLLGLGLDPNVKDSTGNCAIHGVRSLGILDLLLSSKCDINVTNSSGETPLLSYVKTIIDGDEENQESRGLFLNELLRAEADLNQTDANGLTALHLVKNVKIAQILLEQPGTPINTKNNEGETPILYIHREQPAAQTLFKQFLCNEALDITVVTKKNVSVLSVLVSLDDATMSDVLETFSTRSKASELEDIFIQHCNSVDHYGCPVLITACSEYTNSYCLDKLLNVLHLNPNIHPDYQPLEAENKDTIKRLIERGANVNGVGDAKRKTPLMHAIGGRNLGGYKSMFDSFAILLAAGADPNVIDPNGDSALDYASRLENIKDARRTIAALILANVTYDQQTCENKIPLIKVEPFGCLYLGQ